MPLSDSSTSLHMLRFRGLLNGKTLILASRGFPTSVTVSSGVSSLYIYTRSKLMKVEPKQLDKSIKQILFNQLFC